jgi:DNA ligase-1
MGKRTGIQLCYPFEERRLLEPKFGWTAPYLIQPKLDGDRARVIIDAEGGIKMFSSELTPKFFPHIFEELRKTKLRNIELDGELYEHSLTHQELRSRIGRTVNPHEDEEAIQFHIFDIVSDEPQIERTIRLQRDLEKVLNTDHLRIVYADVVSNIEQIMKKFQYYIDRGYEGFVLREARAPYMRKRSPFLMKFKPKKEDVYTIVGVREEISIQGKPKNALGALVLMDNMGTQFKVGTGFTAEQRQNLWKIKETLIGKSAKVMYQALTNDHIPRFPVFVEII